jgi:hypothetical protein
MITQVKQCSRCYGYKDLSAFPQSKNAKDGLYSWCKVCNTASTQKYYAANRDAVNVKRQANKQKNKQDWRAFFIQLYGEMPQCSICLKALDWNADAETNCGTVVNWDHRHGNHAAHVKPANWLHGHLCNEKNQAIWHSFDFGILCNYCNGSLPTNNRIQWLEQALKYARQ